MVEAIMCILEYSRYSLYPLEANSTPPPSVMATRNESRYCQISLDRGFQTVFNIHCVDHSIFSNGTKYKAIHLTSVLYWFHRNNSYLEEVSDLGLAAWSWVEDRGLGIQVKKCNINGEWPNISKVSSPPPCLHVKRICPRWSQMNESTNWTTKLDLFYKICFDITRIFENCDLSSNENILYSLRVKP